MPIRAFLGVLTTAFLLMGCSSDPLPKPTRAHRVRTECPPRTDIAFFFLPEETEGQRVEYASQFLAETNAPSLSCGSAVDEGYRISRLAPGRPSVVIEVLHVQSGWTLHAVEFANAVYGVRGTVTKEVRTSLTDAQAQILATSFVDAGFWRTRSFSPNTDIIYDGPWVTLEARRGPSYHVVFPLAFSFGPITSSFFNMAGLDLP